MKGRVLYLPSTPLNVLLSAAMALHYRSACEAQIWLIDQKNVSDNPYCDALKLWNGTPFATVGILSGGAKGLQKIQERSANFSALKKMLESFIPDYVVVGSDRRVEFQFVMQHLRKCGVQVQGVYLDDGLYSYAGRQSSRWKDGVNALLKKMIYGFWWQEPLTVGASSWVKYAWLLRPNMAVEPLQRKELHSIDERWLLRDELAELSKGVAEHLHYPVDRLSNLDVVVLVAHPNNVAKMPDYERELKKLVESLTRQGRRVGVKYHPRAEGMDSLGLLDHGAREIIPAQMAFEFCLPLLPSGSVIVGDVGTAVLTSRWLREDLKVYAILKEQDDFQQGFVNLSKKSGVAVVSSVGELSL
ncbi:MAG: hypothetical protein IE914_08790 [Thiotrichales bacterium]|nr:hypothetical protein [Thiotrichales bacterium]